MIKLNKQKRRNMTNRENSKSLTEVRCDLGKAILANPHIPDELKPLIRGFAIDMFIAIQRAIGVSELIFRRVREYHKEYVTPHELASQKGKK